LPASMVNFTTSPGLPSGLAGLPLILMFTPPALPRMIWNFSPAPTSCISPGCIVLRNTGLPSLSTETQQTAVASISSRNDWEEDGVAEGGDVGGTILTSVAAVFAGSLAGGWVTSEGAAGAGEVSEVAGGTDTGGAGDSVAGSAFAVGDGIGLACTGSYGTTAAGVCEKYGEKIVVIQFLLKNRPVAENSSIIPQISRGLM